MPWVQPDLTDYSNLGPENGIFTCGKSTKIGFDAINGGISHLEIQDKIWVNTTASNALSRFAAFAYNLYNETDFQEMHEDRDFEGLNSSF